MLPGAHCHSYVTSILRQTVSSTGNVTGHIKRRFVLLLFWGGLCSADDKALLSTHSINFQLPAVRTTIDEEIL